MTSTYLSISSQWAKSPKNTEKSNYSAILSKILLQTAFSAILPTGLRQNYSTRYETKGFSVDLNFTRKSNKNSWNHEIYSYTALRLLSVILPIRLYYAMYLNLILILTEPDVTWRHPCVTSLNILIQCFQFIPFYCQKSVFIYHANIDSNIVPQYV